MTKPAYRPREHKCPGTHRAQSHPTEGNISRFLGHVSIELPLSLSWLVRRRISMLAEQLRGNDNISKLLEEEFIFTSTQTRCQSVLFPPTDKVLADVDLFDQEKAVHLRTKSRAGGRQRLRAEEPPA